MQKGFTRHTKDGLTYYTIPSFDATGLVRHCFTTRYGGVSKGETSSMNLGFNTNDTRENVLQNYDIIGSEIGIDAQRLVFSDQTHHDKVRIITSADCGKGISCESDIVSTDAFVCAEPNVPFITFYADCVPLYFLDPIKKVAALAHSGWRGTVKQIGSKTIDVMKNEFGCDPQDILVGIGPSIGQCHFEVDCEVAKLVDQEFVIKKDDKYYIDLWGVIMKQLALSGIKDENITLANICTYCNNDEFFSHRITGDKRGKLGAIMQLI